MHLSRSVLTASAFALTVFISGCGGGGGSSPAIVVPPPVAPPPPGTLDANFGTGGVVITPIGVEARGIAVVLQPDGKFVVAGVGTPDFSQHNLLLARYIADGTLDSAFGTGGIAMAAGWYWADGVALQADGKIITVGLSYNTQSSSSLCTVARFSSGGVIDATFGVGGTVATQLARPEIMDPSTTCDAVALQQDGKIVIAAGSPAYLGGVGVIRLNADGSRDVSFGNGGEVVVITRYSGGTATGIVVQSDGKIIVGGYSSFYIPTGKPSDATGYSLGQFVLARFDTTGAIDTTFGQDGIVLGPAGDPMYQLNAVVLQPNGNVVVVTRGGEVLRFLANGTPDAGFGIGGKTANISGSRVALQSNGKIVIAGAALSNANTQHFAVWRLGPDGVLDSEFGTAGSVSTAIGTTSYASAVAVQPNGQIIAVGQADTASRYPGDPLPTGPNFALARYFGDPAPTVVP